MTTSDLDRLADLRAAYSMLDGRVAAGEPWALATSFGTEPEASWGPREVLAHVSEMLPFWLGEMERVVDGDGVTAVHFGRASDDPLRVGLIARDRTLPVRVLFDRIDRGLMAWMDRLGSLTGVEFGKSGVHPRLGLMPVSAMAERFVTGHAEDHASQLEEILAAGGG
ncbi:MAG: hypothetical protein WEG56_02605 [Chloroflexota bacterium]